MSKETHLTIPLPLPPQVPLPLKSKIFVDQVLDKTDIYKDSTLKYSGLAA